MTLPTIIEIAEEFDALKDAGLYEEAGEMLTDDFVFSVPLFRLTNKKQWVTEFPKLRFQKSPPVFEGFQVEDEDHLELTRKGVLRIGGEGSLLVFHCLEKWIFDSNGNKIKSITATAKQIPVLQPSSDRERTNRLVLGRRVSTAMIPRTIMIPTPPNSPRGRRDENSAILKRSLPRRTVGMGLKLKPMQR